MKSLVLVTLIAFSSSAFSLETMKGKLEIDNVGYEVTYTYNVPFNQTVTSQKVRIVDDVRLPEQTEPMPAFCMYDMIFPAAANVVIKNLVTEKIVYSKKTTEYFSSSAYGGLVEAKQCEWNVYGWSEKVAGLLRVTETKFDLNGKSYRFFLDTNLMVDAYGTSDELVVSRSTAPKKGSDGRTDGEIWVDTLPAANGDYQRVWAPLFL